MAQVINKRTDGGVTNKTLRNGNSGTDVKALQTALINAGYDVGSTGADGVYGSKTAAAVKAYQKANGLAVDGIAGKNTLGSLYGNGGKSSLPPAATNAANTLVSGAVNAGMAAAGATKPKTPTTPAASTQAGSKQPAASSKPKAPAASSKPKAPAASSKPKAPADKAPTKEAPKETPKEVAPFTYEDFTYHDFTYDPYGESDIVQQARALLAEHEANKLGAYQPVWQDEADAYLSQYQNRGPFSYDFNSDALYNQYKDMYTQQGQMAMMDTMGQAAAMTGGYGNSYAQTVGQQAYNQYLGQLNNVMPELYQMAHDQYNQEGQELLNMYGLYMDREAQEYGKYQDELNNWYTQLEHLTNRYDSERDYDYKQWLTGREQAYDDYTAGRALAFDQYSSNRALAYDDYVNTLDMAYKQERDAVADAQWQAKFDADDAQWQAEFDEDTRRYEQNRADELGLTTTGSSSGGGSGSGGGGGKYDPEVAKTQQMLVDAGYDIKVDGIDGPKTKAALADYNGTGDGGDGGREGEIETWIAKTLANVTSSSFDPYLLINGSSYLKSESERAYAKEVLKEMYGPQKKYK